MKPPKVQPAGSPEQREHFAAKARDLAFRLSESLGTGELGDERYQLLPVGDARCREALRRFLTTVEAEAIALFDCAVAYRDLPDGHNIVQITLRKTA